jgi:NADPH-dependent ferric siderophore reductase
MGRQVGGVCEVVKAEFLTPRMRRITLAGDCLEAMVDFWEPEQLVRLYFPPPGETDPPEPYVNEDGRAQFRGDTSERHAVTDDTPYNSHPLVRAFTARHLRTNPFEMDVDFFIHEGEGTASDWARGAKPGDRLGVVAWKSIGGWGGYMTHTADLHVLAFDETAMPAAMSIIERLPAGTKVLAFAEVEDEGEHQEFETKADLTLTWLYRRGEHGSESQLVGAIRELDLPGQGALVWACGEIRMGVAIRTVVRERGFVHRSDEQRAGRNGYKTQAYWRRGATEMEREERMRELSMKQMQEGGPFTGFTEIGMDAEDETLGIN